MDLDQILENRLFPVVLVCAILMGVLLVGGPAFQDKVKTDVIEDLRSNYTPGPYAPGFDPDKVNPNFWRGQQLPAQQMVPNGATRATQGQPQPRYTPIPNVSGPNNFDSYPEAWNKQWEDSRN
jgi:hypothetical protein